jgi:hypothetical protein
LLLTLHFFKKSAQKRVTLKRAQKTGDLKKERKKRVTLKKSAKTFYTLFKLKKLFTLQLFCALLQAKP